MNRAAIALLLALAGVASCSKDKHQAPVAPKPFVCDSTVTYTQYVVPVMNAYCAISGCHAGTYPAAGILLSDYTDCKLQVLNSDLLGTLRHSFGSPPMPYPLGTLPLSDSLINIMQCWSDRGCPE